VESNADFKDCYRLLPSVTVFVFENSPFFMQLGYYLVATLVFLFWKSGIARYTKDMKENSNLFESPATISVAEARSRIGNSNISRSAFYEAVKRNEIPTIRIGRRVLVIRGPFEELLTGSTSHHAKEEACV